MALFDVLPREEATHAQIAQGVVYVFADGKMARYALSSSARAFPAPKTKAAEPWFGRFAATSRPT